MDPGPSIIALATPVTLGLGAFAAILLTDGTEDLSLIRFTIAALVFLGVTCGSAYIIPVRMTRRRLAKEDAAHRAATVARFEAEVERITGRPFPTDRTDEK